MKKLLMYPTTLRADPGHIAELHRDIRPGDVTRWHLRPAPVLVAALVVLLFCAAAMADDGGTAARHWPRHVKHWIDAVSEALCGLVAAVKAVLAK